MGRWWFLFDEPQNVLNLLPGVKLQMSRRELGENLASAAKKGKKKHLFLKITCNWDLHIENK